MHIIVVGLSHKSAPLELRERLAFRREALPEIFGRLKHAVGLSEAAVLSTCNRVEIYGHVSQLNGTVERLESGLDHLDGTLASLDNLAKTLLTVLQPVELILERMDNIVSWGETMMTPISATEHVFRGVMDRLRSRPAQ